MLRATFSWRVHKATVELYVKLRGGGETCRMVIQTFSQILEFFRRTSTIILYANWTKKLIAVIEGRSDTATFQFENIRVKHYGQWRVDFKARGPKKVL